MLEKSSTFCYILLQNEQIIKEYYHDNRIKKYTAKWKGQIMTMNEVINEVVINLELFDMFDKLEESVVTSLGNL